MTIPRSTNQTMAFSPTEMLPFIQSPAAEQQIKLQSLDVKVVVTGLYSETNQTMTFYNPNSRDLEGELHFPLPDNASVCGYGLDVNGKMIDGVVVPKEEARKILETEIRKGVDPGLIEQVQGNMYRTRIYPIPAQGTRTVRISYINDLVIDGIDATYHLPLRHATGIDKVSLKVEVLQSPVQPEISDLGNLNLQQWQDSWTAEAIIDPSMKVQDLLIRLPKLPDQIVSVETNNNTIFFNVSSRLQETNQDSWQPKRIGIAWDASGSRLNNGQNIQETLKKDFQLLTSLSNIWDLVTYDLLIFRNEVEKEIKSFNSTEDLINHLQTIPYDGGTDFTDLDFAAFDSEVEACLLFSDGLGSGNKGLPVKSNKPVIAVNSSTQSDTAFLDYVAGQSNGISVNLIRMDVDRAVNEICKVNQKTKISMATGCSDVFTSTSGDRLSILGIVNNTNATVHLLGSATSKEPIGISAEQASKCNNISRAWAGCKARELALFDDNSEEILSLAREYGLVTSGTSLLVLESLEQYLEYNIAPPESMPALLLQFNEQVKAKLIDDENKLNSQLDQILGWWKKRVQWWQTDFKAAYQEEMKLQAQRRENITRQQVELSDNWMAGTREGDLRSLADADRVMHSSHAQPELFCIEAEDDGVAYGSMSYGSGSGLVGSALEEEVQEVAEQPSVTRAAINVQQWNPDTPYLNAMRKVDNDEVYGVYLQQRQDFITSPSFFLDCADHLFKNDQTELGIRVLSNLEEMQLGDIALLRIYGWRLQQAGLLNQAISIFERILEIRDDEPQSHRDLALALGDRWQKEHQQEDALQAMELLYTVISRSWDRFPEIEIIALMELNRLIYFATAAGVIVPESIDPQFIKNLDLDIRISMSWDADLTDVDLHIFEPDGGHGYYAHNKTTIGGLVSKDFTQGYGPEEYINHNAMPGIYKIKAHYYGSHQQTICGPCTITATVFVNYGRQDEKKQVLTLRLDMASDEEMVGEITIDSKSWDDIAAGGAKPKDILKKFRALETGMSIDEVKAFLGMPDDISGDKIIVLIYSLNDQSKVELQFEPGLKKIRHIMDGAVLDLL